MINVSGGVMSITSIPPVRANATGQFGYGPLSPGTYTLTAMTTSANAPRLSGYTTFSAQGTNPITAVLSMAPTFDMEGRVAVEGLPNADMSSISVRAVSTVNAIADAAKVTASAAGTFKLVGVGRGSYVLDVTLPTPDSYVKSARLGDIDVLNDGFRLDIPPDRPLEIVISAKGGTIRGTVLDRNRAVAGGVTVALVPDETRRQRNDLFRSATTDAGGRYDFRGIPPGSYKVFAWEDIELKSWMEPAYLRVFEDLGKLVAVTEGSSQGVDVLAISPLER
jgi:hypothetical protein